MSNMSFEPRPLWDVVPASGPSEMVRGRPIHHHCEWLRMLIGRPLALAQPGPNSPDRFDFLVLGIPLALIPQSPARAREVLDAVTADIHVLRKALVFHHQELRKESRGESIENPFVFIRSYEAIAKLRLPEPGDAWRITDEGLTIVQWGLRETARSRRFLDFTPQDFDELERRFKRQIQERLGEPSGQPSEIDRTRSVAGIEESNRNASETPPPLRKGS